ncbi:MAG TPA: putative glycoside hydrolase [Thermomicrobiales bacterium]|nr:putative glycoside hydrolase [Thermomicrobiales bacterium]
MAFGRDDASFGRRGRRRRTPALPIFMSVAIIGVAAVFFLWLRPIVSGTVTDAYSGAPIAGVTVTLGDAQATTDRQGRFTLPPARQDATLTVTPPEGYAGTERALPHGAARNVRLTIRPTTLSGTVRRLGSEVPLSGITLHAVGDAGQQSTTVVTDQQGHYILQHVPENARLVVEGPGFTPKGVAIGQNTALDLDVRPDILKGVVRATTGAPIAKASISIGKLNVQTGPDGAYELDGVPDGAQVVANAPGFISQTLSPADKVTLDFTLEPLIVRAIYLTPDSFARDEKFNALLALADRTEINAMVIDFKDETGWLFNDSQVPLAREIGAAHPNGVDFQARLKTLREHHIYAIARIVCMLDPTLATAHPELAAHNSKTGGIWKNNNGVAWVNAMQPGVWQYLTDVALDAVNLGFNEIQFDYVRFPTDGDMEALDLGAPDNITTRTEAIGKFLKTAHDALAARGVPLGADIFGIVLWDKDDNGIGQQLETLAPYLDYICPMVYPSHFAPGSMGFDLPNDHPYDVILQSLQRGGGRIEDAQRKFRPWLQDFSFGPGIDYGPNEVRAQIQATYDFGSTGWMLWNASNAFTEGALKPKGQP